MAALRPAGLGLTPGATSGLREELSRQRPPVDLARSDDSSPEADQVLVERFSFDAALSTEPNTESFHHTVAIIGQDETLLLHSAGDAPGCVLAEGGSSSARLLRLQHNIFALLVAIEPVSDGVPDPTSLTELFDLPQVDTLKVGTAAKNQSTFFRQLTDNRVQLPSSALASSGKPSLEDSLAALEELGDRTYIFSSTNPENPNDPDTVVGAPMPNNTVVMAITLEENKIGIDRLNGLSANSMPGARFTQSDLQSVIGWVAIAPDGTLAISGRNTADNLPAFKQAPQLAVRTTARISWSDFHPSSRLAFPWLAQHPPDHLDTVITPEETLLPAEEEATEEDDPGGGICVIPGITTGPIQQGIF